LLLRLGPKGFYCRGGSSCTHSAKRIRRLSFLITGSAKFAGGIAATEVITKVALFYGHERVWAAVTRGRPKAAPEIEHRPQMTVSLDRRHYPVCTPAT
jgi:uncharacterized membrane protein